MCFFLAPDVPTFFGTYESAPLSDFEQQILGFNRIRNQIINATNRIVCYNQIIYDDLCLEETEYAGLTLAVRDASARTEVRPMYDQVAIQILDDDCEYKSCTDNVPAVNIHTVTAFLSSHCILHSSVAVVGLERTHYEVGEEAGMVEVCVIVSFPNIECPIQFPFAVDLNTSDVIAGEQFIFYIYMFK